MTLDGWCAASTGHSRWVTNESSRQFVHRLRDKVDGVMVGVGTVIADDPQLTTRIKKGKGKDPLRIVVDTHLRTPPGARVLKSRSASMTLIAVGKGISRQKLRGIPKGNVSILVCKTRQRRIDIAALLEHLGEQCVTSLLVEGGATLLGHMIRERLIDKFFIFKAPKILGGGDGVPMAAGTGPKRMDECLRLRDLEIRRIGDDTLFIAYPDYRDSS